MAGHSKWANIQHRKNRQDAKKGKIFTKLIREITVAARRGGADISGNPRLRLAVDKALSSNMTRDTIDRAVKRGSGADDSVVLDEVRYEGYGPGGTAIIVDCMTDNRNRTVAEVRFAFTKHGGNLGANGSVAYLFKQRGVICFAPGADENKIMETALDSGADDIITNEDGSVDVYTTHEDFSKVQSALEKSGLKPAAAETSFLATISVNLDGESSEKLTKLVEALEDLDDVQEVYTNAEV
jgi:YebC/PmpR family DNA-binding regulatory protein